MCECLNAGSDETLVNTSHCLVRLAMSLLRYCRTVVIARHTHLCSPCCCSSYCVHILPAGKFKSHIDYWDAIENQQFLSFEAVKHVVSQLWTFSKPPAGLDTPDYVVLRRFRDCEVRRYPVCLIASVDSADVNSADRKRISRGLYSLLTHV